MWKVSVTAYCSVYPSRFRIGSFPKLAEPIASTRLISNPALDIFLATNPMSCIFFTFEKKIRLVRKEMWSEAHPNLPTVGEQSLKQKRKSVLH